VMTVAKALANGIPIGATLATDEVASAFSPGTHGSTFGGNPFATAVALTVLTAVLEDKLPERAARLGRVLRERLDGIRERHPKQVKDVRSKGLLLALDLVPPVGDVLAACRDRGLLALTAGDNALRFAPALIVQESEIDEACGILDKALGGAPA